MQHDFLLLDRSGSMGGLWVEAISSINAYVHKLAQEKVDTGVTLVTFDSPHGGMRFDILRDRITPSTWRDVTETEASPRGMTPLNDATAMIINLAKVGNYDKVAITIITDGHENDSREYKGSQGIQRIKELLDQCRAKNWQITYLGANFDNATQAASYGAAPTSSVLMASGNFVEATRSLGAKRSAYAATGQSINFSEDEKETFSKLGSKS